jgi:imidazolonepropionase-like amidohydrolase
VLTHVPLDLTLDDKAIKLMLADNRIVIPTLTMMKDIIDAGRKPFAEYLPSRRSVLAMYRTGVTILAGTDACTIPHYPHAAYGNGIHKELELLVDAGLSKAEALQAATSLPAKTFGLNDRGVISLAVEPTFSPATP